MISDKHDEIVHLETSHYYSNKVSVRFSQQMKKRQWLFIDYVVWIFILLLGERLSLYLIYLKWKNITYPQVNNIFEPKGKSQYVNKSTKQNIMKQNFKQNREHIYKMIPYFYLSILEAEVDNGIMVIIFWRDSFTFSHSEFECV